MIELEEEIKQLKIMMSKVKSITEWNRQRDRVKKDFSIKALLWLDTSGFIKTLNLLNIVNK